jgi:hypothetical protein
MSERGTVAGPMIHSDGPRLGSPGGTRAQLSHGDDAEDDKRDSASDCDGHQLSRPSDKGPSQDRETEAAGGGVAGRALHHGKVGQTISRDRAQEEQDHLFGGSRLWSYDSPSVPPPSPVVAPAEADVADALPSTNDLPTDRLTI